MNQALPILILPEDFQALPLDHKPHLLKALRHMGKQEEMERLLPLTPLTSPTGSIQEESLGALLGLGAEPLFTATLDKLAAEWAQLPVSPQQPGAVRSGKGSDQSKRIMALLEQAKTGDTSSLDRAMQLITHPAINVWESYSYSASSGSATFLQSGSPNALTMSLEAGFEPITMALMQRESSEILLRARLRQFAKWTNPHERKNDTPPFQGFDFQSVKLWLNHPDYLAQVLSHAKAEDIPAPVAHLALACAEEQMATRARSPEWLDALRLKTEQEPQEFLRIAAKLGEFSSGEGHQSTPLLVERATQAGARVAPSIHLAKAWISESLAHARPHPEATKLLWDALVSSPAPCMAAVWEIAAPSEIAKAMKAQSSGNANPSHRAIERLCKSSALIGREREITSVLEDLEEYKLRSLKDDKGQSLFMCLLESSPTRLLRSIIESIKERDSGPALLQSLCSQECTILTQLSFRKKGDALALMVGLGETEKAKLLLSEAPHIPQARAKETLKYLRSRDGEAHKQALVSFEALLFEQILSNPLVAPLDSAPAQSAPAPSKRRL